MKLNEQFFKEIYNDSNDLSLFKNFNECLKKEHLTELLASTVVKRIQKDTDGIGNKLPNKWNYLVGLRDMYKKEHANIETSDNKAYRREYYGKDKDFKNDKLISPIEFLKLIIEGCLKANVSLDQIQAATKQWFGDSGLQEMDVRVIDRAIEELKTVGNLDNFWDKNFNDSLNQDKLIAPKDDKANMCYFDKGYDFVEKKPIK